MKSIQEMAYSFFHNKDINNYIRQQQFEARDEQNKRKFMLLSNYFSQKRVEHDDHLSDLVNKASDIMLNDSLVFQGERMSVSDLWTKIGKARNKEERDYYIEMQASIFNEYKNLIIDIIQRRNELSRREGYESYVDLYFSDKDIDKSALYRLISGIKRDFIEQIRTSISGQSIEENNRKTGIFNCYFEKKEVYQSLGFFLNQWGIHFEDLPITLKDDGINPKHHSSSECVSVSIPDDVRIYLHADKAIVDYYYTVFHEYGHALHESNITCDDYIFKMVPPWYSEAMASLIDKLFSMKESLSQLVTRRQDIEVISSLNISERCDVKLGNTIGLLFEMSLYLREMTVAEIDASYNDLIHDWVGKQGKGDWGKYIIAIAKFPFINAGYLLAQPLSNQIICSLSNRFGAYLKPEVFRYVVDNLYNNGNREPWHKIIEKITGEQLNMKYLFSRYQ
jgi:oligoendopeptidase F